MSNSSKNQDAAWDFISYLLENGALGMYEAGDRIPAKLADQELDEIAKELPDVFAALEAKA